VSKNFYLVILLYFVSIGLNSCVSSSNVTPMSESFISLTYDFREYSSKGFMFTPEKYLGEYESIGIIEIIYVPEFIEAKNVSIRSGSEQRGSPRSATQNVIAEDVDTYKYVVYRDPVNHLKLWLVSRPNTGELIKNAYETANEMGANAVTQFSIVTTEFENDQLVVQTIKLTGFAIKRLE
jgi:hypothetical protein